MKQYIEFLCKLIGILLLAGALFALLIRRWWGIPIGIILLIFIYLAVRFLKHRFEHLQMKKRTQESIVKTAEDGFTHRDLNHNGKLDIYEDPRRPVEDRIEDLLSQMTVEEKCGLMFSPQMEVEDADKIAKKGGLMYGGTAVHQLYKRKINAFCAMGSKPPKEFAAWTNALQKAAEGTRLGIPVTISSDPRNIYGKDNDLMTVQKGEGLSMWPCALGFGAAGDEALAAEFGRLSAKELRAEGIHVCIAPVADTATEPRWPRVTETYGEDSGKNGRLAAALIRGMQGEKTRQNVACCVKHFPGGGPQKDGDDPHFTFGKDQIYPGGNFDYHLKAFKLAFEADPVCVMPYYGRPVGLAGIEEVGMNYNLDITRDLLRKDLGYGGIVYTDYTIVEGLRLFGFICMKGRAWGLEHLSADERLIRLMETTCDWIGGECCSKRLAKLVRKGKISEERIDISVRKILKMKFELGLFDDPYVDEEAAEKLCGTSEAVQAGEEAMRRSIVMLKKDGLPLKKGCRVYAENVDGAALRQYAKITDSPQEADAAIIWLDVPHTPDNREIMTDMMQGGSLEYPEDVMAHIKELAAIRPVIVILHLTRPAVIDWLKPLASGIFAEFHAKPEIFMEAVFGEFNPSGTLPFSLPGNAAEVAQQRSDTPFDYTETTYDYGFGLTYDKTFSEDTLRQL